MGTHSIYPFSKDLTVKSAYSKAESPLVVALWRRSHVSRRGSVVVVKRVAQSVWALEFGFESCPFALQGKHSECGVHFGELE